MQVDNEFFTESLENAKKLYEQRLFDDKVEKLVRRAGGFDLENKELMRALAVGKRSQTDGWLEWEKKHVRLIGLPLDEETDEEADEEAESNQPNPNEAVHASSEGSSSVSPASIMMDGFISSHTKAEPMPMPMQQLA